MSQNAVTIPNTGTLTGLDMVNDANAAMDTIETGRSGNSDPGAIGAFRIWNDTTTGYRKIRNAANNAWVTIGALADLGIQSGIQNVCVAAGTADVLTGAFNPAIITLPSTGLRLRVRATLANATTTPTFQADATTAYTIVKGNNLPLAVGDIAGAGMWLDLDWDNTLSVWVLLNPATGVTASVADASTTVKGKVELSTDVEAIALADTVRALVPANLAALLNVVAGGPPIYSCRAWGNINLIQKTGTYSQSGTTVTVSITAHGGITGQKVGVTIGSGTGVSGSYVITGATANSYTYTAGTSLTTSGNITQNSRINAGGNISGITYNAVADFTVAFTTAMPDTYYSVSGIATSSGTASTYAQVLAIGSTSGVPTIKTVNAVRLVLFDAAFHNIGYQSGDISFQIFR